MSRHSYDHSGETTESLEETGLRWEVQCELNSIQVGRWPTHQAVSDMGQYMPFKAI